jgi:putative aminopeptidase FrvX
LFDQQLEGQRVTVFGQRGPVPAVVAVRSVHLTRGVGRSPRSRFPSMTHTWTSAPARSGRSRRSAWRCSVRSLS